MMAIRDWPALVLIILVCVCVAAGAVLGARCNGAEPGSGWIIPGLGTIAHPTSQSGKPPNVPGLHPIITGSGVWIAPEPVAAGDSLPVTLDVIQHGHQIGVTVSIDSIPVVWQNLDLTWPRERFSVYAEAAWIGDRFRPAVGLAWKPVQVWGVEAGPAVSVGLDQPVWGAASVRLSRRVWSTIEAGAAVGYRVGDDPGLHLGASVGFAF
jgi:hypothetical protein